MAPLDVERTAAGGAACDERTPLRQFGDALKKAEDARADEERGQEEISLLASPVHWGRTLVANYSWRLLAMVACTTHLLKGFVAGGGDEGLVGKPIEFLFAELHLEATELQLLRAAALSPWALKPVIALLSDAFPIFGYRKRPYVIMTTIGAVFGASMLGLRLTSSVEEIVFCLWLIFLNVSAVDVLVEARQSEEVKLKKRVGPQFLTYTWVGINLGQIVSVVMIGPLIQMFGPHVPYLVAAPFIILVLWPTLANFLGERQLPVEERGQHMRVLLKHPVLCALTLAIGCLVLSLVVGTFLLPRKYILIVGGFYIVTILTAFTIFMRKEISNPIVFFFLMAFCNLNIDGALFYFYTDSAEKYPEGPHFSVFFYTSGLGLSMMLGYLTGFITGEKLFCAWSYQAILVLTISLTAVLRLSLLPLILRSTPLVADTVWACAVTYTSAVVNAWMWLPKQVMGAHLTPHGMEATTLGLIAGSFNLANILSSYFGGFLLQLFNVEPSGRPGESAKFHNLWRVQVVAALSPCIMFALIPILLPRKSQTDALLVERPDSATHDSPYEKWQGPEIRGGY